MGCGCNESKKPCKQKSCACPVKDLSTDCVVLGGDLECSNIEAGLILTEALQRLDEVICEKFSSTTNYIRLKNVGVGVGVFKQTNLTGEKELKSIISSDNSVQVTATADEIDLKAEASFCQPRSYKTPLPMVNTEDDTNVYVLRDSFVKEDVVEIPGKDSYGVKLRFFENCESSEQDIVPVEDSTYQAHINTIILSGDTNNSSNDGIVNYRQISSALIGYSDYETSQATFKIGNGVFFNPIISDRTINRVLLGSSDNPIIFTKNLHRYNTSNDISGVERYNRLLNQDGDDSTTIQLYSNQQSYATSSTEVLSDDTILTLVRASGMYYRAILLDAGVAGSANITINGVDYLMAFDTDLLQTVDTFISTHYSALSALDVYMTTATIDIGTPRKYLIFTSFGNSSAVNVSAITDVVPGLTIINSSTLQENNGRCTLLFTSPDVNTFPTLIRHFPFTSSNIGAVYTKELVSGNIASILTYDAISIQIGANPSATIDDENSINVIDGGNYKDVLYTRLLSGTIGSISFTHQNIIIESLTDSSLILLDRTYYSSNIISDRLVKLSPDLVTKINLEGSFPAYTVDSVFPTGIKVLGDDTIMVAGVDSDRKLYRINPDGTLTVGFTIPAIVDVYAVNTQSDGKIIVSGTFSGFIKRVSQLGVIDNTFLANFAPPTLTTPAELIVAGISVDSVDRLYIYGTFTKVDNAEYKRLFRVTADGELDTLNFYKFFTRSREMTSGTDNQYFDRNTADLENSSNPPIVTFCELETDVDGDAIYLKVCDDITKIPIHVAFEINLVETVGSLSTYPSS
jgi:hypothetical protein